jgi:transposase
MVCEECGFINEVETTRGNVNKNEVEGLFQCPCCGLDEIEVILKLVN